MKTHVTVVGLTAALAAFLMLPQGCSPPVRDLDQQQVRELADFDEVMWFLATIADPGFSVAKSADPSKLSEADFARFADMGRRVPWGAQRLVEPAFSRGPEFDGFAADLRKKAEALLTAAEGRRGQDSTEAALSMKATCKGCHDKFR